MPTEKPFLYLHIGLHKTGSTYLQQAVFSQWKGLGYVGRPLRRDTIRAMAEAPERRVLFSSESLSGSLLDAYRPSDTHWIDRQVRQIRRLGELFPGAGIIMGFRGHEGWLLSIYKHYLKYGGERSLDRFLEANDTDGVISLDDLRYMPRIEAAQSAFPGRIFPFLWEELSESPEELFADMARFVGLQPPDWRSSQGKMLNEGVNQRQADLLLRLNRITGGLSAGKFTQRLRIRSLQAVPGLHRGKAIKLTEAQANLVRNRLGGDWQELTHRVNALRKSDSDQAR